MVSPARDAAWRVLLRLGTGDGRLDESLAGIPELEGLGQRDRALANELITGTVKRRISVDAVLGAFTKAPLESTAPEVLEALRLAAFQMLFLDRVPAHAAVDDAVALLAFKGSASRASPTPCCAKSPRGAREVHGLGARRWQQRLVHPSLVSALAGAAAADGAR